MATKNDTPLDPRRAWDGLQDDVEKALAIASLMRVSSEMPATAQNASWAIEDLLTEASGLIGELQPLAYGNAE